MKKLLVLGGILSLILLAGCGGEATPPVSGEPASASPFNLSVCLAPEPQTVDPALTNTLDSATMIQHMFEGLMKWSDSGRPLEDARGADVAAVAPGQAESYDKAINADGTVTYTFHLRDGIQWSDGRGVTAGDFVYAWQRLVDPATAASYAYLLDMVKGYDAIVSGTLTGEKSADGSSVMRHAAPSTLAVSAPDDKTFVVTLRYDCPYFVEVCALPATYPVRRDIVEGNDAWTQNPSTYIGNGPYKMSEWVHNAYLKVVKSNTYYGRSSVGPDSITFTLLDNANATLTAFRSGQLQFIESLPVDETASYQASGDLNVVSYTGTYYISFNTEKAPFNDARVRRAFSLAINRNDLVNYVTQSGEVPAGAFVPFGVYDAGGTGSADFRTVGGDYYSTAAGDYDKNCEKARALLAEAGYPDGKGFPQVDYLYNTGDSHKAIGEALQSMWQNVLNVRVALDSQDWNVILAACEAGDYQLCRGGWTADYNDPCSFLDTWSTGSNNNIAQYCNPKYDALIRAAKSISDPAARMSDFHKAENLLIGQDSVLAPLYFYTQSYLLSPDISGISYTPLGFFLFDGCTKK
jgi:oligopeptide transport system substrate-binding protein